jgi:hypothetical protein
MWRLFNALCVCVCASQEDPNQRWASRWDVYLTVSDSQIHWVAIINSIMIAFFLTAMVAMIMMRTLRADLRRYHEMETQEEAQEETGWKLVHGDVFRPPSNPLLLSVLVGSGVQIISMSVITLIFALLGFLSPANRGGLMTAMVVLYVLMGYVVEMCSVCCTVPHSLTHSFSLSLSFTMYTVSLLVTSLPVPTRLLREHTGRRTPFGYVSNKPTTVFSSC